MISRHLFICAGVCVLTGCVASPQTSPGLTRARSEVATAANNPAVFEFAMPQLEKAQDALKQSESAHDSATVDYYAFLASRYAEAAEQIARQKRAEQVVSNASAARNAVLLQGARTDAAQARAEAEQARQQAQSAKGLVLTPRDILFKSGSAQLNDKAVNDLHQIAEYLRANPGRKVLIEGFTDSTGSATVNQQLSEQRADAVRLALANDGVEPSRLEIRGMGPSQPIASNTGSAGRLINRRVSIVISNADGTLPQSANGSSSP